MKDIGVCIFCDLPVYRGQDAFYLALEKPMRLDIPVHKSCWKDHRESGDIKAFLQENLLDYLEKYSEEDDGKEKTKKFSRNSKNRKRK